MQKSKIEKVYVLGSGTLAYECSLYAKEQGADVLLLEMAVKQSVGLEKKAEKAGIPYEHLERSVVYDRLCAEEKEILLVSAINEFIIPKRVLDKPNITAVNLHQALLPRHPGRNAESWAIFEQEEKSGITWHFMRAEVDKGDIILQKEIVIDDEMTAYKLFQQQIALAKEGFCEIFQPLMEGTAKGTPQPVITDRVFHKSTQIPNEGYLDLSWDGRKISAFLRAMDYSVLKVLGSPKLILDGKTYQWAKYQICSGNTTEKPVEFQGNEIHIYKNGFEIILKKYKLQEEM
ncbi:MAG: hypothetical protein K2M46_03910 [Lachnospiraceae bacterium]|nr:hypothetical protein [Lachnospiraceae bacterium]